MTYEEMRELQAKPYDFKVGYAEDIAWEFIRNVKSGLFEYGTGKVKNKIENAHISIGGLDSITLYFFLRHVFKGYYDQYGIRAISVSILEDKSIQEVHKQIGVEPIKPLKTKHQVINEFGFPVISKAKARKIGLLQNPDSEKLTFIHAIMTGDMGEQGGFKHSDKIKLPDKWIELFGGNYAEHRPDLKCKTAPFPVSADCCYWMKELPCDMWARAHNSVPFLGLMASEGGQREHGLTKNGCNYFGKSTVRSCPFNIFTRQDLLQLALDLNVPVPRVYGEIKRDSDGLWKTTRAQRTGCSMCGFGIHIEPRPHRFDRLREDNPKEWEFWMYRCYEAPDGEVFGWGKVLDWIGVEWEDVYVDWKERQISLF